MEYSLPQTAREAAQACSPGGVPVRGKRRESRGRHGPTRDSGGSVTVSSPTRHQPTTGLRRSLHGRSPQAGPYYPVFSNGSRSTAAPPTMMQAMDRYHADLSPLPPTSVTATRSTRHTHTGRHTATAPPSTRRGPHSPASLSLSHVGPTPKSFRPFLNFLFVFSLLFFSPSFWMISEEICALKLASRLSLPFFPLLRCVRRLRLSLSLSHSARPSARRHQPPPSRPPPGSGAPPSAPASV